MIPNIEKSENIVSIWFTELCGMELKRLHFFQQTRIFRGLVPRILSVLTQLSVWERLTAGHRDWRLTYQNLELNKRSLILVLPLWTPLRRPTQKLLEKLSMQISVTGPCVPPMLHTPHPHFVQLLMHTPVNGKYVPLQAACKFTQSASLTLLD